LLDFELRVVDTVEMRNGVVGYPAQKLALPLPGDFFALIGANA
jgi:hypothetical protein